MPRFVSRLKVSKRNKVFALWLLALIPALGVFKYYFHTPLLGDAGAFAGIATHMKHGFVLYRDVWDNKAPGIFFLFQLALTLSDSHALTFHFMQLIFVWLWIGLTWQLFFRFHAKSIWFIVLLTPVWMGFFTYWPYYICGHFTEEYGCYFLFFAACTFLLTKRKISGVDIGAIATGLFCSVAILIKEPFALAVMLFAVFILKTEGKKTLFRVFCGAFFIVLLFAIYLTLNDAWPFYFNYLSFGFNYATGGTSRWITFKTEWVKFIENWSGNWHIYSLFLLVCVIPGFRNAFNSKNNNAWWLFFMLFIGSNFFLFAGNTIYGHYLLPFAFFAPLLFFLGAIYCLHFAQNKLKNMQRKWVPQVIIMLGIAVWLYRPLSNSLVHFYSDYYHVKITESEERKQVLNKTKNARSIFVDAQDMGRIYFYTNKTSNMPFPSPYYVYFTQNNLTSEKIFNINTRKLMGAFRKHPPQMMIGGKDYNAGFILGDAGPEIGRMYTVTDSFLGSEGNTLYIREKR